MTLETKQQDQLDLKMKFEGDLRRVDSEKVEFPKTEQMVNPVKVGVLNVEMLDLEDLQVWGRRDKIAPIDKQEIVSGVNLLTEPYKSEVSDLIKANNVKGLQAYLNEKIKNNLSISQNLKEALAQKGISFRNNQILEDGKFGPQTLEALKCFIRECDGDRPVKEPVDEPVDKPVESSEKEKGWDFSWILQEMADKIEDVEDTGAINNKDRSDRNTPSSVLSEAFKVDPDKSKVILSTRGGDVNTPCCDKFDSQNYCEYDRKTGQITVKCGYYSYPLTGFALKIPPLNLGKDGLPMEGDLTNRKTIKNFADIANTLNMLKKTCVFTNKGAIEFTTALRNFRANIGGKWLYNYQLELNNAVLPIADTKEITTQALEKKWLECGAKFTVEEGKKLAGLLNAMKLDMGKITRYDDIATPIWKDGVDKETQEYIKTYLKKPI
ncbi:MAG TPA: hypothetical protein PK674_03370 [Candidatus Absconditabacterales bacterium]|nr:hypothetical protein [Candidatus Absconditabacterales bacterium]HOQ79122.1 hypothetical protein [Candidatus Absconditabacterales bacterium]HPK27592.1 hypothetical protein [Candidatus Absconditabacterales bacterium]